jgi:hypothetical protein
MREKLLLNVYLAATLKTYEFLVPYDLTVGEAANLMARLLESKAGPYFSAPASAGIMLLGCDDAGRLLGEGEPVRDYVSAGVLVNGRCVALV